MRNYIIKINGEKFSMKIYWMDFVFNLVLIWGLINKKDININNLIFII